MPAALRMPKRKRKKKVIWNLLIHWLANKNKIPLYMLVNCSLVILRETSSMWVLSNKLACVLQQLDCMQYGGVDAYIYMQ